MKAPSILLLLATVLLLTAVFFDVTASTVYAASSAQGSPQDQDILAKIAAKYHDKASGWANQLEDFAKRIFKVFLLLDLVIFAIAGGIGIATGGKSLAHIFGELVLNVLLPAAFMFCVIEYYQQWSGDILKVVSHIADSVEPKSSIGANNFFKAGIYLFDKIWEAFKVLDVSTWPLVLAGLIIIIVYALMAMKILLIKCESYIVLNAGVIILGMGAFAQTRSYATNFITYVLAVAIKLYVMQLIIGIAFSFVDEFMTASSEMTDSVVILGASIVMLGLLNTIPDMCAGIIQGQHVGSGNALASAMGAFAGAVAGTVGAAAGAAGTVSSTAKAVKSLGEAADAQGLSGKAKAGFMAREMGKAAWGTNEESGTTKGTFMGRLNSHMNARGSDLLQQNSQMGGPGSASTEGVQPDRQPDQPEADTADKKGGK